MAGRTKGDGQDRGGDVVANHIASNLVSSGNVQARGVIVSKMVRYRDYGKNQKVKVSIYSNVFF